MPVLFISYSHDSDSDAHHRDKVLAFAQRLRLDGFDTRLDQFLPGGPAEGWHRWMLDQLDAADFVLLVCSETYYRRFRGHEAPGKGKGADWEGSLITLEIYHARSNTLKFVPLLFSEADEAFIPEPLRGHNYYSPFSAAGYADLCDFLAGQAGVEPAPLGTLKPRPRRQVAPLTFPSGQKIATPSRLPRTGGALVGREAELAALEAAWQDKTVHILSIVAWGGVGKTSLVAEWVNSLAAREFEGADYFDWSFYSQGTSDQSSASADAFLDAALRFFGDTEVADSQAGAWEKGSRLAQLVGERSTLLVLDGLEPLQHPPGPLAGILKDPGLQALLRGLALRNAGLCVLTTRHAVVELAPYLSSVAREWNLDRLSAETGTELLKRLKVQGSKAELAAAVEEVDGHALTLNLVGRYVVRAFGGDIRKRDRVRLQKADEKTQSHGHAFRAMATYERWLATGGEDHARQLALLRLLGLFDRPAPRPCLTALRAEPAIVGLTEPLLGLDEEDWNTLLSDLAEAHLVVQSGDGLDAHPLIREYFASRLKGEDAKSLGQAEEPVPGDTNKGKAWREAHSRLFDFLKRNTEHQPSTLDGLRPLYQAVYHGCQAGRQPEACAEVYFDRISRGNDAFVVKKLGAFGADLGAVACFFEPPWSRVSPSLSEAGQAWLLNQAAFRLRALGRLQEAVEPMRAGLAKRVEQKVWVSAARIASNLSELDLTLGEVQAAVVDAEQSLAFADRSGDAFHRMVSRTVLADSRHKAGEEGATLALFREAEVLQAKWQPQYPLLFSLGGFRYCDLLLAPAERAAGSGRDARAPSGIEACAEIERRAMRSLPIAEQHLGILDIALDHISLGRARLYRAILEGRASEAAAEAQGDIEKAVSGLRNAGYQHMLVLGLLTRAWLRFTCGDAEEARADLDEAWEIAERGSMRLHLADVALYRARFFKDCAALAEARRLVTECGYGRRLVEIEDLEAKLASG